MLDNAEEVPKKARVLSFQDLIVWQKAMDLVEEVYALNRELPATERYQLVAQISRAAVSIPANIAEGHARSTRRDYAHFVSIARGSNAEVETYLLLVIRLGFATTQRVARARGLCNEVGRMLSALRDSLLDSSSTRPTR
jgi:four helix bundle protein